MSGNTPAELVERRKPLRERLLSTCTVADYDDRILMANVDDGTAYRNPDGPEAADQLTVLTATLAEAKRAWDAMETASSNADGAAWDKAYAELDAALTGEQG